MLTTEDKKWLIETIDNRMDVKFAEQEAQLSITINARFASMMDHMDRRFNEIREELKNDFGAMVKRNDERFEAIVKEIRNNTEFVMQQAAENTRYINVLMETDVLPRVAAITETVPAYHETYSKLEERIDMLDHRCNDTDQKLAGIKAEIRKK